MAGFAPIATIARLPERSPIRTRRPDRRLGPDIVRPGSMRRASTPKVPAPSSPRCFTGRVFWLVGCPGQPRKFHPFVLEPRYRAAWAEGNGERRPPRGGRQSLDESPWERLLADSGLDGLDLDGAGGG